MSTVANLQVLLGANTTGLMAGLRSADSAVTGFARNAAQHLGQAGQAAIKFGVVVTAAVAPIIAGFNDAAQSFMAFDRSMTNSAAVLGLTRTEMAGLTAQVTELGENALAGPQAVVDAFYDVAGGVLDASTHLAILEAAIKTAEAGAASMTGTTTALIGVMNAYGFSAEQAAFVSDVLTRTVGMGVGTMDEFASAMPKAITMAAQLGIGFDEIGASMAFMTTKTYTASEASTSLMQAMVALLNPNEAMKEALAAMGVESGSAALKAYGLAGTLTRLQRATGGSEDAMVRALGSVEAVRAALALNQPGFETFFATFVGGIEGATDAARDIQLDQLAADVDLVNSAMTTFKNEVGYAIEPILRGIAQHVRSLIKRLTDFVQANPEVVQTILKLAGGAMLAGGALLGIGVAIQAAGYALGGLAVIFSPVGLLAGVAALAVGFVTNFGGIRDTVLSFVNNLGSYFDLAIFYVDYFRSQLVSAFPSLEGILGEDTFIENLLDTLSGAGTRIDAALAPIRSAFRLLGTAISAVFDFHIRPVVEGAVDFLGGIWASVRPSLEAFGNWFIGTGLPDAIKRFAAQVFFAGDEIGALATAMIIGGGAFVIFTVASTLVSAAVGALTTVMTLLTTTALGPLSLAILLGTALIWAYQTNLWGVHDAVDRVAGTIEWLFGKVSELSALLPGASAEWKTFGEAVAVVADIVERIRDALMTDVMQNFGRVIMGMQSPGVAAGVAAGQNAGQQPAAPPPVISPPHYVPPITGMGANVTININGDQSGRPDEDFRQLFLNALYEYHTYAFSD